MKAPLPPGARRHGLRATGARALERPRCERGPGRGAGVGGRVQAKPRAIEHCESFARTLIRPCGGTSPPIKQDNVPMGEGRVIDFL
ncbi:hypothetical protein XAC3810_280058 [Xanthomonas citri pv. citri]|uniref:Uncharacterized protein n=1 Tax=Xanthomonas citri pv. citri TaxID=611301 RepID=A0A0U5FFY3_XANCI|nr:Hypothetical Protein XCAW_02357 [Xanthomonas citri subsp. citri Aw12879]QYF35181.1 hypothetical protein HZS91_01869 [Xanthomonas citri pv. citri]QYF44553.1 hypothetical protein HZS93_01846 [Xanthomonas citri]QYF39766.1 hypothetical protein HZS92_01834 [Xanthomonas citri pv. citri]CEE24584.1 hypothetical protein XAC1083_270058 [Xanthomonas citri pv. citri]